MKTKVVSTRIRSYNLLFLSLFYGFFFTGCGVNKKIAQPEAIQVIESSGKSIEQPVEEKQPEKLYRAARTRLFDLLHTRLSVRFDWEKQRLQGTARLQLRPYFYPQDQLILDARNFDIHYVKLVNGTIEETLKYFYDNNNLFISLDTTYSRNQSFWVEIEYTAKPTERELQKGTAITSDQGLYFINHDGSDPNKPMQIWTQGETESNSAWFPTIDSPNEQCTQEMYITVKDRFKTLSNGELIYSQINNDSTRTDYWKLDIPHAPYLFMMAIGEFAVIEDVWKGIPVNYYVEPEYADYAKDIFGNTPEMIGVFSNLLNVEYPWPKYSQVVVRDFVSGAMENTTSSVFMEDLQVDRRELLDYNWDDIIAHELFHQWFGNLVTCESWANLTLNEAFANYSEYLWKEHKLGRFEADMHGLDELDQYLSEAVSKQVDLIRFSYIDKDDMFDSHSYAKGGRILHMLRKYVGDEAFFKTLEYYLNTYRHQPVEVHDLRLAFEKITGEDLNWFFNQWFLASGHPQLEVSDSYEDGIVRLEVFQLQNQKTTPIYQLPLYVDIYANSEKLSYHIIVDKEYQAFEFKVPFKPDLVIFDVEQQLLGEINHEKSLEELIFQYKNVDMFLPHYQALDSICRLPIDSVTYPVLMSALHDGFWVFRQMAVGVFEGYDGEHMDTIRQLLVHLALHDPNSLVRTEAVGVLYEIGGNDFLNVYKEAIYDSSYSVAGNALFALSMSDPMGFKRVINEFMGYNNFNIVIPLASYFIDQDDISRYDWFLEKLRNQDTEGLYYMVQYFGEFLMGTTELMKRRGLVVLENYARNNSSKFVRLSAYQSIGLLTDLNGVSDLMANIRENEKDKFLREIYVTMQ